MTKKDYDELTKALELAETEALKYADYDDGGTCNFDSPMVILKGTSIKTLEQLYGEHYGVYKLYAGAYIIGNLIMKGQGNRHTKMAEAFSEKLRQLGYNSYVHYVMD